MPDPLGHSGGSGALIVFFSNMSILNNFHDNHMLPGYLGGAILGLNSSFFVLNSNFSQIIAQLVGAMTLQRGSVVRIENCFFLANAAFEAGGVIYISDGSILTLQDNIFSSNVASGFKDENNQQIMGIGGVVFSDVGNNIIKEQKSAHVNNACTGLGSNYFLQPGTRFESKNSAYFQNIGYLFMGNISEVIMDGNEITSNKTNGVFV